MAKAQDIKEQRKKDRERQARRRQKLKELKAPDTHAVERAATETLGFLLKKWSGELDAEQIRKFSDDVFSTLETILADRLDYNREEVRKALKRLIKAQPGHTRSDFIPTLKPRDSSSDG